MYSKKGKTSPYLYTRKRSAQSRPEKSLSPTNSVKNAHRMFNPEQATVRDEDNDKPYHVPLRVPKFTQELSSRRYNFDVKDVSNQTASDTNSKFEAKLIQYRRAQEANMLMNALPNHIRQLEMEKVRQQQANLQQQEEDEQKWIAEDQGFSGD